MAERRKKRPRDRIQLAKLIGDIATGQVEDRGTHQSLRIKLSIPHPSGP